MAHGRVVSVDDAQMGWSRYAQALAISTVVAGAGAPFGKYALPFDLALGVTAADMPLWYGASEIYRDEFALAGAAWTAAGPVSARPEVFPEWVVASNLWVNSGWQCYDRFNNSQGDPDVVLAAARLRALLLATGDSDVSRRAPRAAAARRWQIQ